MKKLGNPKKWFDKSLEKQSDELWDLNKKFNLGISEPIFVYKEPNIELRTHTEIPVFVPYLTCSIKDAYVKYAEIIGHQLNQLQINFVDDLTNNGFEFRLANDAIHQPGIHCMAFDYANLHENGCVCNLWRLSKPDKLVSIEVLAVLAMFPEWWENLMSRDIMTSSLINYISMPGCQVKESEDWNNHPYLFLDKQNNRVVLSSIWAGYSDRKGWLSPTSRRLLPK